MQKNILLILTILFFTNTACATPAPETNKVSTYELLNLFGDVFERVRKDYVEKVTDEKLIESAINGMLVSLDPHSSYLDAKNFAEMQVQTKGEFGGLGIEVTMENGLVKVVSPIDDTPAFKAGVKAGDYISKINGEVVMGLTLSEAVEKMRGKVGEAIDIEILRKSENKPLNIKIIRAIIEIKSVRSHVEGNIGYIRITSFSETTYEGLKSAINKLKTDIKDMKGIVLDLRNNPGGLLNQAVFVSDAFLNHGEIVSTRERNPQNIRRYSAKEGDLINGLPMVVLINNGSASASEIVSGALQDHKRAVILGTKSFGKGSVQTVIPLKAHGAMKLTTARYYTPSGRSIQGKGITPDILVKQAKIVPINSPYKYRFEADLRGSLDNDKSNKSSKKDSKKDIKNSKKTSKTNGKKDNKKADYQLQRALDLLHGISVYENMQKTLVGR